MQLHRIGDAEFIGNLGDEEKQWLGSAIVHIIMADKTITKFEMEAFKEVLCFLDEESATKLISFIKEKKTPELPFLTQVGREEAAKMLFYVGTAAIIDNLLVASEVEEFKYIGSRLGFDSHFCHEIIQLLHDLLTTKKKYLSLLKTAASIDPLFVEK